MPSNNILTYKITLSAIVITLAIFLGLINLARAETATGTPQELSPACNLNEALDELLTVKDGTLTGLARDRSEIKARKAVIEQIIICANKEVSETETRLNELALTDSKDEGLRVQFLASLQVSDDQHSAYAGALATSMGLTDVKKLAEDILTWRKSEYLPLLSQINDFILVINNEQSTKIARARFEKISTTLSILRLANVSSIKGLLHDADTLTTKSDKLNADAHILIRNYFVPINATSTASGTVMVIASGTPVFATGTVDVADVVKEKAKGQATTTLDLIPAPTVVSLVKASIESLRGAYTNYLKISVAVRNILGL